MNIIDKIILYISEFLALMIVLPFHEFAHAFVAYKCGDPTAKNNGRMTLNPFAHFDIAGLVCFVLAGFGWAKPVPIQPLNFKKYKRDSFFVAGAGVTMNYILAFLVYPLFVLSLRIPEFGYYTYVLQLSLSLIVSFSLCFFVFNLIPVFPLDGFMMIDAYSKKRSGLYRFLRFYGIYVLYFLFFLSILADVTGLYYLDVLGIAINFIVGYIKIPITAFWGLIL